MLVEVEVFQAVSMVTPAVSCLLGGSHHSAGEVPHPRLQTSSDGHPGAGTVFLQGPHAGLLLPGQGTSLPVPAEPDHAVP